MQNVLSYLMAKAENGLEKMVLLNTKLIKTKLIIYISKNYYQLLKYKTFSIITSHQIQQIIDIHFIGIVSLSELLKIDIFFIVLDDLSQGEVLDEEIIKRIFLG